VMTLSLV